MKKDPYSALAGLDQRLFQETAKETTKQQNNETTLSRNKEATSEATKERLTPRSNDTSKERRDEEASAPSIDSSMERKNEATGTRVSSSRGHVQPGRVSERHSHDLYHDQVRWMNRLKLDIEERHGRRVTSNAIVQLAIDILRDDYERNGEGSNLIRVLAKGRTWRLPPADSRREEAG